MHTSGALDREKAREAILSTMGLRAWNESAPESVLNALEACVVPDPRLARIEALVSPLNRLYNFPVPAEELRAILRGDQ